MIMAAKTCFITGAARGFGHLRAEAALVWRDNSGLLNPFSWLSPIPSSPTPVEQHNLQYWRLRHRLRLMLSISDVYISEASRMMAGSYSSSLPSLVLAF
jgi:hypothetical protein